MKKNIDLTENLLRQFDKELNAILKYDLKQFNNNNGKFIRNNSGKNQDNDLLVA